MDALVRPFPSELTTPPVTKMCFVMNEFTFLVSICPATPTRHLSNGNSTRTPAPGYHPAEGPDLKAGNRHALAVKERSWLRRGRLGVVKPAKWMHAAGVGI